MRQTGNLLTSRKCQLSLQSYLNKLKHTHYKVTVKASKATFIGGDISFYNPDLISEETFSLTLTGLCI